MKEVKDIISEHFIKCNLSNAVNAKTLWVSSAAAFNSNVAFSSRYSYLDCDTKCFSNVIIDNNNKTSANIERYGGSGLGGNGGGSRSANINDAQVKGIGANVLVGEGVPADHSYGGLDIYCAVIEIILTELLNKIMPLGAITNRGLILIDEHAGSYDGAECWAVLLVREIPLRPGHLLHASDFKPRSSVNWGYRSEESRIRGIYRDLDQTAGSTNFVRYLGNFLAATANQFAFARMSRLLHGGLSESNMSMDGKWLDVPLAGFVPAGRNWSQQSDFYSEAFEAIKFIGQCTYNYTKYAKKTLNPQPLYNYYIEQLNDYKKLHCAFLLGIDSVQMDAIHDHEEVCKLCESFESIIISKKPEAIKSYAQLNDRDPLDNEIISIWKGIASSFGNPDSVAGNAAAFRNILRKIKLYTAREIKSLAVQSIKRLLLCRFFYLKNSVDQARNGFSSIIEIAGPQLHTTSYIEQRIELINWIYEKNDQPTITLINIPSLCIKYHREKEHYDLQIDKKQFLSESISDIKHLFTDITLNMSYLEYNFEYYFKNVISILCELER